MIPHQPPSPELTCTCGAVAPPGARFCPMCARPLVEHAGEAEEPEAPFGSELEELVSSEPERLPITLSNPDVVRSCYSSAILAALLGNTLSYLFFVWYPAAGFFSVYNYRRRTGVFADVREGARLGLVTGGMIFLISLVLFAFALLLAGDTAGLAEAMRQQVGQMSVPSELKQQMLEILRDPTAMGVLLVMSLGVSFVTAVLFSVLGAALGAKILEKE